MRSHSMKNSKVYCQIKAIQFLITNILTNGYWINGYLLLGKWNTFALEYIGLRMLIIFCLEAWNKPIHYSLDATS